jgi:hypothetical protein
MHVTLQRLARSAKRIAGLVFLAAAFAAIPVVIVRTGLGSLGGSFERDFLLGISSAFMGLLASLLGLSLNRTEQYRQGAYTERAKAVQSLLHDARVVKSRALEIARQPGVAGPVLMGVIEHQELLLRNAFEQSVWVGEPGVEAVRRFNAAIARDNLLRLRTPAEVEAAVGPPFDRLRRDLMADLGYVPE